MTSPSTYSSERTKPEISGGEKNKKRNREK
jgi:hypothetical protein